MSSEIENAEKALEVAGALFSENAPDFDAQIRNATKAQAMATLAIGHSMLAIAEQFESGAAIRVENTK